MAKYSFCDYCGKEFKVTGTSNGRFCRYHCFKRYKYEHVKPIIVNTKNFKFMVSNLGVFDLEGNELHKDKEIDKWTISSLQCR